MLDTLYLDPTAWDFALDINGNIAVANGPYSAAQDAASACRLWQTEYIYDTTRGVPYDTSILGQLLPSNVLAAFYNKEAQTVPDVATTSTLLQYNATTRMLSGQINLTLVDGTTNVINI